MVADVRPINYAGPMENAADPFEDFWILYPRHEAKKDARKAWEQIPKSLHNQILTATALWRPVWLDDERKWLPYAATWLRGERWEDELPAQLRKLASAAHVQAVLPTAERGEMPQHVRDLIAKLRGKQ